MCARTQSLVCVRGQAKRPNSISRKRSWRPPSQRATRPAACSQYWTQLYRHQSALNGGISHGLGAAEPGEPLLGSADVPLSNHSTTCPFILFLQRMSLTPSPLKSPVSSKNHWSGAAEPGEPLVGSTVVPLSNQSTTCPVVVLYQTMSLKPSPLKSPVPTMSQGLGAEPGEPLVGSTVVPFMNQSTTCPVVGLYQRMSLIP